MGRLRIQTWSLGRVARKIEGQLISPRIEAEPPRAVSIDTRTLEGGELFFAIRGERFDGHDFLAEAIQKGAHSLVVDDLEAVPQGKIPFIVVEDTLKALSELGHALWQEARQQGLHTVAVTGSNGKTTTKEILRALWSTQGAVWATPGNLNNHIGVPLTLCALPERCDHLILEIGANHPGEVDGLIELAPAEERVITSIGQAHLEGFGSIAGIRKAKSEVFHHSQKTTAAIVPVEEREALIPDNFRGKIVTFGHEEEADIRVELLGPAQTGEGAGSAIRISKDDRKWELELPFPGAHNARNLAAALATLFCQQIYPEADEINGALRAISLPDGRLRALKLGAMELLDDAYNANPSSMRASFEAFELWCGERSGGRRVAVIGDMFELGEAAEREHRELAMWLARRQSADDIAFVGEFAPLMAEAAMGIAQGPRVHLFGSVEDVASWLVELGPAQVFLKGSRGNRLERIIEWIEAKIGAKAQSSPSDRQDVL